MNEWIIDQGSKEKEIRIDIKEENGLFVSSAKADIKKGDLLYSIPMGISLDPSKAKALFGSRLESKRLRTGDIGLLALLLLFEKQTGSSSKYYTYIQSMPDKVSGFLSWKEDEIEEFSKSTTRKIKAQIKAINADYDVISNLQLFPAEVFTKEAFYWAMGMVKSRYIFIDNMPMLAPGLDFMEVNPFATNEPFTDSAGMFGGRVIKVSSDRAYTAGSVVGMSYGLKNSAECIEDHGIIPDIPLEEASCELNVALDKDVDKFSGDKENVLEDNGWKTKMQFDLEADSSMEIDPDLIKFLRLKLISGKDSFILEPCFMNTVMYTLDAPFSKPNEISVMQYIKSQCRDLLAGINKLASASEDSTTVKAGSGDSCAIKVILAKLRLQERAALECTILKAQSELTAMEGGMPDTREYYQERRLRELDLLRPLDEYEINSF